MADSGERAVKRVGVMGGTFDPIHIGHLIAGSEALHAFSLDQVLFVPTGRPWQKSGYSDPEDRFMMTTLGADTHRCFAVSRMELDRRGPTYTADTMQQLYDFYRSEVELFFIAGADAISKLDTWERVDELGPRVEMVAVPRAGFDLDNLQPGDNWPQVHVMDMPMIDVSATQIRERVRLGRPIDFLVPPSVAAYIRRQGLYAS